MAVRYRLHTPEDQGALVRFWSEHGGWDALDAKTWTTRLMEPPVGSARVVIGENDAGEIVAQFAFIPSLVWLDGAEVPALRPFAPIVAPGARDGVTLNPLAHPVVAMFNFARGAFRDLGDGVLYMIPDPRWRRLFRPFPQFRTAPFPLLSRPLPLDRPLSLGGHTAGPLDGWGSRVDALWEAARELGGVQVVRDRRTLPWKVGQGDYALTAVERGNDLVGLVASRQKGDRQWLVCDFLAADPEAVRPTLAAAINEGHRAALAPPDKPINKVSVLGSALLEPAAEALGLTREKYTFYLVVERLDDALPKAAVAPERWTVSPND